MYRGETCEDCGLPVAFYVRSYWHAPNELWNAVIGTPENPRGDGVVLCPSCFIIRADARAIPVCFKAERMGDTTPAAAVSRVEGTS